MGEGDAKRRARVGVVIWYRKCPNFSALAEVRWWGVVMVSQSWFGICAGLLMTTASLAQQANPEIQVEIQQGVQALEQGNFSTAERHFSHVLKTDPNQVEVRAHLGLAYYADRKYSEAVEAFRLVLKQNPSVRTAQTFLPLALAALDQCEQAIPGLSKEFSSNPDLKLRRVLGLSLQRCLLQSGKQAEADQAMQELLAKYSDDIDVLYEAGQMYAKLSSQIYLRLMKIAPHSARGFQVMGQVAASEGNWEKAVDAYRQAIRLDPNVPGVHLDLAVQLLLHSPDPNAWEQALVELNKELEINPASAEAQYEVGEVYRKHDQPEKAKAAFRAALRLRPGLVEARLGLAKALRQQNQKQEALAALEPARETAPDNAAVRFLLAQLYRDLSRTADSKREEEAFRKLQEEEAAVKRLQASPSP